MMRKEWQDSKQKKKDLKEMKTFNIELNKKNINYIVSIIKSKFHILIHK